MKHPSTFEWHLSARSAVIQDLRWTHGRFKVSDFKELIFLALQDIRLRACQNLRIDALYFHVPYCTNARKETFLERFHNQATALLEPMQCQHMKINAAEVQCTWAVFYRHMWVFVPNSVSNLFPMQSMGSDFIYEAISNNHFLCMTTNRRHRPSVTAIGTGTQFPTHPFSGVENLLDCK